MNAVDHISPPLDATICKFTFEHKDYTCIDISLYHINIIITCLLLVWRAIDNTW